MLVCSACGSGVCLLAGGNVCRHTGQARTAAVKAAVAPARDRMVKAARNKG